MIIIVMTPQFLKMIEWFKKYRKLNIKSRIRIFHEIKKLSLRDFNFGSYHSQQKQHLDSQPANEVYTDTPMYLDVRSWFSYFSNIFEVMF